MEKVGEWVPSLDLTKSMPAVIKELIYRFSKVVQLPMEEVQVDTKAWMATIVVAKSLGQ